MKSETRDPVAQALRNWFAHPRVARVLVTNEGKLIAVNERAYASMRDGCGLALRDGQLMALDADAQSDLRALLQRERRAYMALRAGDEEKEPVVVLLEPMGSGDALVSFWRASRPPLSLMAPLADFYGLSQQQARVAAELVAGRSVDGIARKLNVTIDTVRSHLKLVYDKTSARSQAELVALVLRCLPA